MNIVADRNIPLLHETFGRHGQLVTLDGRDIRAADLAGADVLLVRSVTRVDARLLAGANIRFVGSATIGTDHLDCPWLQRQQIQWASAPGSNAASAAEFTLAMLLLACERLGRALHEQQVGIIGRGNVGAHLQALLSALGVTTLACDPPLAEQGVSGLADLDATLGCPVISLHVPLTSAGRHPTRGLLDRQRLERLQRHSLVVNTARGAVIDQAALLDLLQADRLFAALDVWAEEPGVDAELVRAATVSTPHVAGYSLDGKRRGTEMIYRAFCAWLGEDCRAAAALPPDCQADLRGAPRPVWQAVMAACPVARDDGALRAAAEGPANALGPAFDRLRRDYPERRDFNHWRLRADASARPRLAALGFNV